MRVMGVASCMFVASYVWFVTIFQVRNVKTDVEFWRHSFGDGFNMNSPVSLRILNNREFNPDYI